MDYANVPYYHGSMPRAAANKTLSTRGDGSFLLRKSSSTADPFALSVTYQGTVLHYSIKRSECGQLFYIEQLKMFPTPVALCEHYMREKGHLKVKLEHPVHFDSQNSVLKNAHEKKDWFHGNIPREEDERRLIKEYRKNKKNGIFLVRQKEEVLFVLSVICNGKPQHYRILFDGECQKYCVYGKTRLFESLELLVEHYKEEQPDGLLCVLQSGCSSHKGRHTTGESTTAAKSSKEKRLSRSISQGFSKFTSSLAKQFSSFIPSNSLDMNWSELNESAEKAEYGFKETADPTVHPVFSKFQRSSLARDSIGFKHPYRNLPGHKEPVAQDLYISIDNLKIYQEIGKGHFGSVKLGECQIMGTTIPCAIKSLTGSDIQSNKTELLQEASIMQKLDHPYIVRLLAVCDASSLCNELMIVLEFAPLGTVLEFLRPHNSSSFPENRLLTILIQICEAMVYLASMNVVHRDLAARNVLLVSENFAKISDFGMSRVLRDSENYYKAARPGSWPLRWYAPEALLYYKFTTKGDVWSYGVTMWEILSYGGKPYYGLTGRDIVASLENGERLHRPEYCSDAAHNLMLKCWAEEPGDRPSFSTILLELQNMQET